MTDFRKNLKNGLPPKSDENVAQKLSISNERREMRKGKSFKVFVIRMISQTPILIC